jgi:hypothetical protein
MEDLHAASLAGGRQTVDQTSRMEGGAIRRVRRSDRPGGVQPSRRLVSVEQTQVRPSPIEGVRMLGLRSNPLRRRPRRNDGATLGKAAVDVLGLQHAADLVDRGLQCRGLRERGRTRRAG